MADDASYGSRENLRRRGGGSRETVRSTDGFHQPGQPIGYLAARGTPYEKKYFSRKLGICCLFIAPPIILVTLAITLLPVLYAVANHALHTSVLHIYASNITSPGNDSFPLTLEGQVKKVGIFPAHIYFREPVDVYWNTPPPELKEIKIGHFSLDRIGAAAGHGRIKQASHFYIDDTDGFGEFAKFLITQPEFTWRLKCPNVHVEAFSFLPTYKNLQFTKDIIIKGFNNFEDVEILDFQLPGDDPAGGITLQVTTSLTNPSPFGVQIGDLELALSYKGMYLGPASATALNVTAGRNIVTLNGRLVPHLDNVTELNLLGEMFTGYINGDTLPTRAAGVSATQLNGDKVAWLSEGISALDIAVPLKAPEPINPIKGIVIDYLSLAYTPETAYQPTIFSNSLSAGIGLPFGFSLDIVSTANTITIVSDGAPVGTIEGAFSNSSTTLNLISAGQTAGTLNLTLPPSPLVLPNNTQDARRELEQFQKAFALTNGSTFALQGAAKAVTEMPLGKVLLDGIKFDVVSGIKGLEGLTKYPTLINTIDVTGGTQEALTLAISTTLVNPSNLNLSIGDSTFQLVKGDAVLGTTTLPNLDLMIGRNDVDATALFHPNTDPQGYETLNRFVSGLDTVLDINGFDGSSNIASLIPALEPIRLNATLPGLKQKLVQMANLTVLDSTGIVDDVANSIVGLANPFSSGLTITRIASNVTSHGINIASIGTPLTFPAAGKALSDSPPIPLTLNLYPPDIFGLLRALVVQSGQDPVQLDGIVQLGGYTLTPTTDANSANGNNPGRRGVIEEEEPVQRDDESASFVTEEDDEMARMLLSIGRNPGALASIEDEEPQYAKPATPEEHLNTARSIVEDGIVKGLLAKRANIYTGFDLPSYVDRAFKVATVNLDIVSDVTIGDYGTTLTFSQTDVPLGTDATLNKLLPVLAAPIVQKIVDGAVLALDRVTILDPQNESFNTALQGSITQAGPFDAVIQFTQGLTVDWQGQALGQIAFPNVSLAGDVGAQLDLTAQFAVASVDYLTTFTKYLLTEQSFIWNIHGTGLSVSALGIVVPNITISKDVMLTGFNGLKGDVIINSFDLPSNDPAGGIHLTLQTTVNNPSQVGVQLSTFGVNNKYNGTYIGPAASEAPFILQANAKTDLPLVGRLVHQDSDVGLAVLSDIFTRFVHDIDSTVNVNGNNAGPPDCVWLNEGIKVLSIDVSLPAQKFQVIKSISLNQLSLFFTTQSAWSPATSSNNTTSAFFIPFAFPIDIQQVGGDFVANYQNQDDAVLNIPLSPSTTDVAARILTLMFQNVPFEVYNDKHAGFSQFLADTTAQDSVTFNLNGKADTRANTAAGLISITQIPFSVDTTLAGLQNLNARPANVSDLDVFHGYSSYLQINVMTTLYNPSAITIGTGDVSFNLNFEDHLIGQAVIQNLVLVPGENTVPTQVKYMPKGGANVQAGQHLLENYVQSIVSNTIIQGTRDTTPIASLKQALSGITLTAAIPPLMQLLITGAALTIPKDIAQTSYASATFTLRNPFTASINLLQVKADASYQGIFLGEINENLRKNIITAPGHTTISSYELPFKFNLDPKNLIRFIEAAAAATNTDLGPLPPLFQQVLDSPSTQTTVSPYPDDSMPPCSSGQQFDVLGAILKTVAGLQTTLDIASTLKLDDYQTDLDFKQNPVPTKTDNSVLYLVGPVGAPIVQTLVSGAALSFSQANITGVTDSGFDVALQGSLTGTGPFDAYIEFPEPVVVNWMGKDIATISLPPICAFANEGAPNLMTSGHLTITNLGGFTDFATYILHNPSFTWTISTQHLRVRALGIAFSDVILQKDISFKAFNGLPGVTISNFNIPSDTSDALNIQTDSLIPSPATLGIELGTANFEIFFEGTDIGPIHASNLFLAPTAVTDAELMGQITRKSGKDLETTGKLFSQYLQGVNQTLQVQGVSVISPAQPNSPVNWLSAAFKTLNLQVILPGMKYQIIYSITLSDLTVNLIGDPADSYTVPSSNNQTIAVFSNPFGFSLQPIKAAPHILIRYQNADTATLDLPLADVQAGTSRGPTDFQNLQLMFRNQNLVAVDHGSFQSFFAQLTDQARGTFDLDGSTDVTARTVIGDIPIAGIPFNVTTSLSGINSFGRSTTISDLYVDSATPQYIRIPLKVTLNNPSNLTVNTKDISLPTRYQGYEAGRTIIPGLGLIPGDNLVDVEFHYMPADANNSVAQALLQKYLQPADLMSAPDTAPLEVSGYPNANPVLTPYESLQPALAGVSLNTTLQGIGTRIVTHINVFIDLLTLANPAFNGLPTVNIDFDVSNALPTSLLIKHIDNNSGTGGQTYAVFDHTFDNFAVPAAASTNVNPGTANSGNIQNVVLVKGLLGSTPVLFKNLDIRNNLVVNVDGAGGYEIPGLMYNEDNVPTSYGLSLGGVPLLDPGALTNLEQIGQAIADNLNKILQTIDGAALNAIQGVLAGIGLGGAGQLVSAGLGGLLCLSNDLPLLKLGPNCPGANSTANATSSSTTASSTNALSSLASGASSATAAAGSAVGSVGSGVSSAAATVTGAVGGIISNVLGGGGSTAASSSNTPAPAATSASSSSGGGGGGASSSSSSGGGLIGGLLGGRDLPHPTAHAGL